MQPPLIEHTGFLACLIGIDELISQTERYAEVKTGLLLG